jgi:hypothetical protein
VLSSLDGVVENAKREIERLRVRQQAAEKAAGRLQGYVLHVLRERSGRPLKSGSVTFTVRRSEALIIDDPDAVPDQWKRTTITVDVPKDPIKLAVYAMRLLGVIGAEELPSEEDLTVAVNVIHDELIFENALALLEKHYSGGNELTGRKPRLVASKKRGRRQRRIDQSLIPGPTGAPASRALDGPHPWQGFFWEAKAPGRRPTEAQLAWLSTGGVGGEPELQLGFAFPCRELEEHVPFRYLIRAAVEA